MDVSEFINQIAEASNDDYPQAFKLLGFVVYVAQEGDDTLLTGKMISQRTYYRWLELVKRAGWGDLLADARLRQAIKEYLWQRFGGLPINQAREQVLQAVNYAFSQDRQSKGILRTSPLKEFRCEASAAVQGGRSTSTGREAKPSALDRGADRSSLCEAEMSGE